MLQRKDGPDYLVDMKPKRRIFRANLLKRYLLPAPSEPSPDDSSDESPFQDTSSTAIPNVTSAAILQPEEELSDHGPELETLNPLQTETVKDVKISQDLSAEQQSDIRALLTEYQDMFTDVPSITPLERHRILLTTTDPIRGKAYSLPRAVQETLDKEIETCCPWE